MLINIPCEVADADMVTEPKMEIIYNDNLNCRINNWGIKGDGKLKFSGQKSPLLRNLMSYLHQILHGGKLFDIVEGHEKFLAIRPPWRPFLKTTIFS